MNNIYWVDSMPEIYWCETMRLFDWLCETVDELCKSAIGVMILYEVQAALIGLVMVLSCDCDEFSTGDLIAAVGTMSTLGLVPAVIHLAIFGVDE